jgi:hypothetical protein
MKLFVEYNKRSFLHVFILNVISIYVLLIGQACASTDNWITDATSGCKALGSGDKASWSGTCADGYASGSGTLQWYSNGIAAGKYVGQMLGGKMHGKGVFSWPNWDIYEGDFLHNIRTGKGTYTWADGDRYDGYFVNGKITGKGVYKYEDGTHYEGDFVDSKRNGKGVITWGNANKLYGDRYSGEFVDNKRTGNGKYTFKNGTVEEGFFLEDKLLSKAEFIAYRRKTDPVLAKQSDDVCKAPSRIMGDTFWPTDAKTGCKVYNPAPEPGDYMSWIGTCEGGYASGSGILQWCSKGDKAGLYVGEMSGGKRHGTGLYTWSNGNSYKGDWANDNRHGKGVFILNSGIKDEATFSANLENGLGVRTNKDGSRIKFIAVKNKIELQQNLMPDTDGCNVSDMLEKSGTYALGGGSSYKLVGSGFWDQDIERGSKPIYKWSGECLDGFATGQGTLEVEAQITAQGYQKKFETYWYKGIANKGALEGEITVTKPGKTLNTYYGYGNSYPSYEKFKSGIGAMLERVAFINYVAISPTEAFREATTLESSNESKSREIYDLIIEFFPKSKEGVTAAYRKAFLEAYSSSSLSAFINTYEKKDPAKLVPKAKAKLSAALSREAKEQRQAEYQREHPCEHLYNGKKVSYTLVTRGLWGPDSYTLDAVVIGIGRTMATIKIVGNIKFGEIYEVSCNDI